MSPIGDSAIRKGRKDLPIHLCFNPLLSDKSDKMRTIVALVTVPLFIGFAAVIASTPPSLNPIVYIGTYDKLYNLTVNSTVEYVLLYMEDNESSTGARINVQSFATNDLPLIVVVRQKKGILSWQLPLLVQNIHTKTLEYNKTARTLCPTKYYQYGLSNQTEFVTVSISTASISNISFNLNVSHVEDFYIGLGEERKVVISPAEPIYYGYTFSDDVESSSVVVQFESDSDVCMTVSIQNTTCPVFDLERNIQFSGYWQTVSRKGGITVPKDAYPSGFFVVLVVKGDDTDCTGVTSLFTSRHKNVTLTIKPSITKKDYIVASSIVLSMFMGFCIFYIIGIAVFQIREGRKLREQLLSEHDDQDGNEHIYSPSVTETGPSQWPSVDEDSSLDEDDIDILEDAFVDKEVIRTKLVLSVCDLARKDPKILRHKSHLYLYYLLTVTVFYTLPVVQLVITYQRVLHVTGNQDLCYYNFLCAHPLGVLSDFNHVFSNFGYVLLGMLFILITYAKDKAERNVERNKSYGIPQHYGLFYAMGIALMMEGILSGSYHVCPNHSNFQFDTSFMYIIAVLCMVKIYQARHPDINARAPVTFGVLALTLFVGLIGVLNGTDYFWIIFTIIHLSVCLALTAQIYYMGRWRLNGGTIRRVIMTMKHDARAGIIYLLRPMYCGRLILLIIANLCNVGLAVVGNMHHEKDFATFLLAILMSNLILYTFFYIIMKICHKERILIKPFIYIFISCLTWAAALYFFIRKSISWALTPAQSRIYNKPCELLNFFDSHDIWHFVSALAMFFSFMVLLTLDDDLVDVHRSQIPVF
ncbi:SID1 transmembrane family member 1-like [Cephus cinctus]|uniref:SID1 transmembrane family member 1-like n=1 Tax=Cephus cinctus TaxID=211228 RepID=A0AAJ7BM30_CEPCN|nr:SID1 transmembrane family member 1-like [Cephus cinctus]